MTANITDQQIRAQTNLSSKSGEAKRARPMRQAIALAGAMCADHSRPSHRGDFLGRLISCWYVFVLGALAGCQTTYAIEYVFELDREDRSGSLSYSDDRFMFTFQPSPSGLIFSIANHSGEDAVLVWDGCYFVDPDGNSYKAFNTDALEEAEPIVAKSKYTAVIPDGARLERFTTASVNATATTRVAFAAVVDYYQAGRYVQTNSGWEWDADYGSRSTSGLVLSTIRDSWQVSRYWGTSIRATREELPEQLAGLTESLEGRNGMGLGLQIQCSDGLLSYRFNFEIERALVSEVVRRRDDSAASSPQGMVSVRELCYLLEEDGGWVPIETDAHAGLHRDAPAAESQEGDLEIQ